MGLAGWLAGWRLHFRAENNEGNSRAALPGLSGEGGREGERRGLGGREERKEETPVIICSSLNESALRSQSHRTSLRKWENKH